MEDILLYFALLYNGNWDLIYSAISNMEKMDKLLFEKLKKDMKCQYVTIISQNYPELLKQVDKPPFVIFYYGNFQLLSKEKTISMVGSRERSEYGQRKAFSISKELANEDYIIISGLAKGIDSDSHLGALSAKENSTIAVLGFGIDYCYPIENDKLKLDIIKKGLVISEYPGTLKPKKNFFPDRNRIIAGLSKALIVVECKPISGAMITVNYALEYGKEVFALPSISPTKNGTNLIIKQGGILIESSKDVIEYYKY